MEELWRSGKLSTTTPTMCGTLATYHHLVGYSCCPCFRACWHLVCSGESDVNMDYCSDGISSPLRKRLLSPLSAASFHDVCMPPIPAWLQFSLITMSPPPTTQCVMIARQIRHLLAGPWIVNARPGRVNVKPPKKLHAVLIASNKRQKSPSRNERGPLVRSQRSCGRQSRGPDIRSIILFA